MTLLEYYQSYKNINSIIHFTTSKNGKPDLYIDYVEIEKAWEDSLFEYIEFEPYHNFINNYFDAAGAFDENNTTNHASEEVIKFLTQTQVIIDDKVKHFESFTKYPYYRMRGKQVTSKEVINNYNKAAEGLHIKKVWLDNHTGILGVNSTTFKYPTEIELLQDMLNYITIGLDFVIAITNWDNVPDYVRKNFDFSVWGEQNFNNEYQGFLKHIKLGIWLHGNTIEFMEPSRAREKYQEYDQKYSVQDKKIYIERLRWKEEWKHENTTE